MKKTLLLVIFLFCVCMTCADTHTAQGAGNWWTTATWHNEAAEDEVPTDGDTVDLAGYAIVFDMNNGATIPASGAFLLIKSGNNDSAGRITVALGTGSCAIKATTIQGGTAATTLGIITVSGTTANTLTVTGNVIGGTASNAYGIYHNSTGTLAIVGNVTGGSGQYSYGLNNVTTGVVTVSANATGGTGTDSVGVRNNTGVITIEGTSTGGPGAGANAFGSYNSGVGTMTINGAVTGGGAAGNRGATNYVGGTMNIVDSVTGGTNTTARGVVNYGTGTLNITGDVSGSALAHGCLNYSTGAVNITGNISGGTIDTVNGVYGAGAGVITIIGNILFETGKGVPCAGFSPLVNPATTNYVQFPIAGPGTKNFYWDIPNVANVTQDDYVAGSIGQFVVPAITDVKNLVTFGFEEEYTGNYTPDFPSVNNTVYPDTTNGVDGNYYAPNWDYYLTGHSAGIGNAEDGLYHAPAASEVWNTAVFGTNSETAGTMHASDIANCTVGNIKAGVTIDDVLGEYAGTGGGKKPASTTGGFQ